MILMMTMVVITTMTIVMPMRIMMKCLDDADDNFDEGNFGSDICFIFFLPPGKVDPYVRVFLMPGTHNELKTKVTTFLEKSKF